MHTIQDLGFLWQSANGVDPITSGVTYYSLGKYAMGLGNFPNPLNNIKQYYKGGQFNAYLSLVSDIKYMPQLAFQPNNAYTLFMALAKRGTGISFSGNVGTITPINEETQRYAIRWQSYDGTNGVHKTVLDNVTLSYALTIDLQRPQEYLTAVNTSYALSMNDSSVPGDNPPDYDFGGRSRYKRDSNLSIVYDPSGDNVSFGEWATEFTFQVDNFNRTDYLRNVNTPYSHVMGNRTYSFTVAMIRNSTTDDIYEALLGNSSSDYDDLPDFKFRIHNSSSEYIQLNLSKIHLLNPVSNYAVFRNNDVSLYKFDFLADDLTVEFVDGINSAWYGVV